MIGIRTFFYLNGIEYAFRRMTILPRIGECVKLNSPDKTKTFKVYQIIYDVTNDNEDNWEVIISIE